MTFGNIQQILSKPIDQATALSPKEKELLSNYAENAETNYSCLIPRDIMDEFLAFANDVYRKHHNEATGMLVGYYLHDSKYPEKKIALATAFLPAYGDSTRVTCEFSYEDSVRHSEFCKANNVQPIIWIHSHPGFGVFYSHTDSTTLKAFFAKEHQCGVVVDNLNVAYKCFKMIDDKQCVIQAYGFDKCEALQTGKIDVYKYNS